MDIGLKIIIAGWLSLSLIALIAFIFCGLKILRYLTKPTPNQHIQRTQNILSNKPHPDKERAEQIIKQAEEEIIRQDRFHRSIQENRYRPETYSDETS